MQKARETRVTLSVSDVKDRERLMQEVQGFADTLLQSTADHDESYGDIVLTFDRASGVELALTLHQLLAVMRSEKKN